MLKCEGVDSFYGPAQALFDVSLNAAVGISTCLLGRNGAGKSTCLRTIMGIIRPRRGEISLRENRISGLPSHRVAQSGVGYVPEDRRIFADLTVEENLRIGERGGERGIEWDFERSYQLFPALKEFRRREGGFLSGGQQQMLTIARALMGRPTILMLDEPTEGLAPIIVKALVSAISELKVAGLTMLIATQDIHFARSLTDYVFVMNRGSVVFHGTSAEMDRDIATVRSHLML